jgi:hypothetical protein
MRRKMQASKSDERTGLRVFVVPDEGAYFAQGYDVDYFASGATQEEAERNFEAGLETMVQLHMRKFGNLDHLKAAPSKVSDKYATNHLPHMVVHELASIKSAVPEFRFSTVLYFTT